MADVSKRHDAGRAPPNPMAMADTAVTIELTSTQIERVVRGAAGVEGAPGSLHAMASHAAMTPRFRQLASSPRLSRSLLLGLLVLASFPADGRAMTVTDVAEALDMSPSTTHRYLATLLAVGLLEQDPRSRRYRVPAGALSAP